MACHVDVHWGCLYLSGQGHLENSNMVKVLPYLNSYYWQNWENSNTILFYTFIAMCKKDEYHKLYVAHLKWKWNQSTLMV